LPAALLPEQITGDKKLNNDDRKFLRVAHIETEE